MIPFTEPLTRYRREGARDPDTRRWSTQDAEEEELRGQVEPATGNDLEVLPEGEITGNEIVIRTKTELRIADENADPQQLADQVEVDGDRYEVRNVQHHRSVIPHYVATCVKV